MRGSSHISDCEKKRKEKDSQVGLHSCESEISRGVSARRRAQFPYSCRDARLEWFHIQWGAEGRFIHTARPAMKRVIAATITPLEYLELGGKGTIFIVAGAGMHLNVGIWPWDWCFQTRGAKWGNWTHGTWSIRHVEAG